MKKYPIALVAAVLLPAILFLACPDPVGTNPAGISPSPSGTAEQTTPPAGQTTAPAEQTTPPPEQTTAPESLHISFSVAPSGVGSTDTGPYINLAVPAASNTFASDVSLASNAVKTTTNAPGTKPEDATNANIQGTIVFRLPPLQGPATVKVYTTNTGSGSEAYNRYAVITNQNRQIVAAGNANPRADTAAMTMSVAEYSYTGSEVIQLYILGSKSNAVGSTAHTADDVALRWFDIFIEGYQPEDVSAPNAPTLSALSNHAHLALTLTWNNPADSDFAYSELYISPPPAGLRQPIVIPGTENSYQLEGLTHNQTYTLQLYAVDSSFNRSTALQTSSTAADREAPAEVSNIISQSSTSAIELSWTNPSDSDFDGCHIVFSPVKEGIQQPIELDAETNSYQLNGLDSGVNYIFSIKTKDAYGNISDGVSTAEISLRAVASSNSSLEALSINGESISGFAPATETYTLTLPFSTAAVTLNARPEDHAASLSFAVGASPEAEDFTAIIADQTSPELNFTTSEMTLTIQVLAEDAVQLTRYTVTILRAAASSDAALSNLILQGQSLNEAFNPETLTYTASVDSGTSSLTVQTTCRDSNAQALIAPANPAPLAEGENTITITVQAEDSSTERVYTIIVTRAEANLHTPTWVGAAVKYGGSTTNISGSFVLNTDESISITASGGKMESSKDAMYLLTSEVEGDFVFTAKLISVSGTLKTKNQYGVGLIIYDKASAASSAGMYGLSALSYPATAGVFQGFWSRRLEAGANTNKGYSGTDLSPGENLYLRLQRVGKNYTASISTDGSLTWTQMRSETFTGPLANTVSVGFAVVPGDPITVVFEDIQIAQ